MHILSFRENIKESAEGLLETPSEEAAYKAKRRK